MSNSIRLLGIGSRMRMNAPSVPVSGERHRQEKRQRRVDVIIAAGEVVAELVAAEDREDRAAVPEAAQQAAAPSGSGSVVGAEVG